MDFAHIYEVGPRDGLQNEQSVVPTSVKLDFIDALSAAGLKRIECTAFVHPKWVPAMADHAAVMSQLKKEEGVSYPVLVPNMRGFENAQKFKPDTVALVVAASETFNQKNINQSVDAALAGADAVTVEARRQGIPVRAYISCALGCPYEGEISSKAVMYIAEAFAKTKVDEIVIGDTIGIGDPKSVERLMRDLSSIWSLEHIACHFHDTYGRALANAVKAYELGGRIFDSSAGGLGGCPYAPGASGNLATEDLVDCFERMGIQTGIDLDGVVRAASLVSQHLGRQLNSRVFQALKGRCHS